MNLGFYLGLAKLYAKMVGWEETSRFEIGVMTPEGLNTMGVLNGGTLAGRRASHFAGGAGMVLPRCGELRYVSRLQAWDSKREKDGAVLFAEADLDLFEAASRHIEESEYKGGIRYHLIVDNELRKFLMQHFDFSNQDYEVVHRDSGIRLPTQKFKAELHGFYRMLDQYCMNRAGVTAYDVRKLRSLMFELMPNGVAQLLYNRLVFDESIVWKDSTFFKLDDVSKLVGECNNSACSYSGDRFIGNLR